VDSNDQSALRSSISAPPAHGRCPAERNLSFQAAEAARDAAVAEAAERRQEAQQAGQRAAVAEARTDAATAETARVRQDTARELEQLRASAAVELDRLRTDATREREELRELLEDRARTLTDACDAQRRRAERAEADLDTARAELAQLRSKAGATESSSGPRRRVGQPPKK
jgi:colicin import membrane protein